MMRNSIKDIQNEQYYKLVADNINDLVALYTPDGILEYVSPSIHRLLGHDPGCLIGISPTSFVHPDDQHLLIIDNSAFLENTEDVTYFEYRLLHKDGHWVYFESYRQPVYNEKHELTNVLAVCRDISRRKHAEQALWESEELYKMLADNILDMVVLLNPDGTRMFVSPSSLSLFGYAPEELTGKHFSDISHPEDAARIQNEILNSAA